MPSIEKGTIIRFSAEGGPQAGISLDTTRFLAKTFLATTLSLRLTLLRGLMLSRDLMLSRGPMFFAT